MSARHPVLVIDVGTSSVRAAAVTPEGDVRCSRHLPLPATIPSPGLAELDASALADAVLELSAAVVEECGPVAGVGVADQRATTIVWDRGSGAPVAPGIGWQDLRTVGTCLELQAKGIRLAPNMSATKVSAILDAVDPGRDRGSELCFGTVDSWVAWTLGGGPARRGGGLHVTDATNVAVTGLVRAADRAGGPGPGSRRRPGPGLEKGPTFEWDEAVLDALRIPPGMLPTVVDTVGHLGTAVAVAGSPPICALVGDQQASLVGQGCTRPGLAKATFGTGGMLDLCTGDRQPIGVAGRGPAGTFPIVAWRREGTVAWGLEAIMLTAGACVDWLLGLGLIGTAAESADVAASCSSTGDVWFVPALMGIGTPVWDFGVRAVLLGVTGGTGRPEIVRAVLEGIAHRGADLLEAAESDGGVDVASLRVDGGLSANHVFVQALADACGRPIELSPELEATTVGAGLLAGMATGSWRGLDELADAYRPRAVVEPGVDRQATDTARARWLEARGRAERTIPELSGIDF